MTVFAAKGDARDCVLMASATFLVFLSHSAITFLSVILRDLGLTEAGIGLVMSAPLVPTLAGMYLSGRLMERFGPLRVVRAGFLMILASHLTLQATVTGFTGVYLSRALHGFGYGIFMPASMTYVKGKLRPERMVYPFGIYASMILLPNIAGPWIMENLYATVGLGGLFLLTAVPSLLGNLLAWFPGAGAVPEGGGERVGYLQILRTAGVRSLNGAIFTVGLVYGIVPTLMALFLKSSGIGMVYYFTPFTAALFAGRFLVIRLLESFPRKMAVTAGFLLMGTSHLWLVLFRTPSAAILSGIVMGLGYSLEYPTLSVWISSKFGPAARSSAVALLNMVFHAGIFVTPLAGGWVMGHLSLGAYLAGMAGLGLAAAAGMAMVRDSSQQKPSPPG